MAAHSSSSMDGRAAASSCSPARPQIAAPSDGGPSVGAAACRLLALPAGLLPRVAGRLEPAEQRALRSVCRAARAAVPLTRLRVCGAPAQLPPPPPPLPLCASAPCPPPPTPLTAHGRRACTTTVSPPQVYEGSARDVCAAALCGRLAAAFPALRELAISPQALQAMAQRHDAADLAESLAGVGALEVLDVCSPFALRERPPASHEGGAQGGALLAQLVARLPPLQELYLETSSTLLEVRAPCPEGHRSRGLPRSLSARAAPSDLLPALLTRRRRSPPLPLHNTRPFLPLFIATVVARRGWRRSAWSVQARGRPATATPA